VFSPGRYDVLRYVIAGLQQSGFLLVEYDGHTFSPIFTPRPVGSVDDIGLFIIVPKIAQFFHVTLEQAITLFFYSCAAATLIIGIMSVLFLYWRTWRQILIGLLSIIGAFLFAWSITRDVQLMYSFSIIAFLPFFAFCLERGIQSSWLNAVFFVTGFIFTCINYIRMNATLGITIWLFTSLFLISRKKISISKKLMLSIIFFMGSSIPSMYVRRTQFLSDEFLKKEIPNYQPTAHVHPFWHTIYAGFGFSNFLNSKDLSVDDRIGLEEASKRHASSIDFSNPYYDHYLKEAVFTLCKEELLFVLSTIALKAGILLYYILRYANVALLALYLDFSIKQYLAIIAGLGIYALIPLLYIPCGAYGLGFITFIQISSMLIINDFISNKQNSKKLRRILFLLFLISLLLNSVILKLLFGVVIASIK
jgi:hypothetical protein